MAVSLLRPSHHVRLAAAGRIVAVLTLAMGLLVSAGGGDAQTPLSPAWLAARNGHGGTANASMHAAASGALSQASLAAVQQSLANMQKAAQAINAMQATQNAARRAALGTVSGVPNGVTAGGLVPDASQTWQNAKLSAQTQNGGTTKVTVTQSAQKAIAYWSSFNVGQNTTLTFDQSAGGSAANTWVVLNRVNDPSLSPSQILGSISAQGQVYIINRNGIIFGGSAQVDVGALLASTADFAGGDSGFTNYGIYSQSGTNGLLAAFTAAAVSNPLAPPAIVVEPGAEITTHTPASVVNGGGFVLLLASAVENAGTIAAPQGQVVLAAGQSFMLTPGYSSSGSGDALATTLGSEIAITPDPGFRNPVTNTGLLQATQGDVTLVGEDVLQGGVAYSTTTVNQRGTIHLLTPLSDATATVTLAPGSVTVIEPDLSDPSTALNSQRAQLIATSASDNAARLTASPALNDVAELADELDQSRIEITSGGVVDFATNSLTMAQGGQVAVAAGPPASAVSGTSRIFVAGGATIDVSGLPDVTLPASADIITVNIQSNELRDSPDARDAGTLASSNVYVDVRDLTEVAASVTYSSNRYYTPGGLLEVSGYLNDVGHTIGEWAAVGGTITFSAGQVVAQAGSVFNLAGGAITYQAGMVQTSWLIASNGQIYNVANAPDTLAYSGVYGGFTATHSKWGVSDTYSSPLVAPAEYYEAAYTVGRDAGSLVLNTPTAVFEGSIDAGVVNGAGQSGARPATVSDPFLLPQTTVALPGSLLLGNYDAVGLAGAFSTDVVLGSTAAGIAGTLSVADAVPASRLNTAWFSASTLNQAGLGGLTVATEDNLVVAAPLTFAAGATVSLTAPSIDITASLTAPAGTISAGNKLVTTSSSVPTYLTGASQVGVTLAAGAEIEVGGLWTNAYADPANTFGAAFANGGSVTLVSSQALTLLAGSVIDVSAGGALSTGGAFSGGKGGSITLTGDDPAAQAATSAPVTVAATLLGYGASGAGTLSLTAPLVSIAADGTGAAAGTLALDPGFFDQGFAAYTINGIAGLEVAPGTMVQAVAPSYVLAEDAAQVATGSAPDAAMDLELLPLYTANPVKARFTQRQGVSLTLQALSSTAGGAITIGQGAVIAVDPGQSVALSAYDSIVVDGTITAPGGAISLTNTRYQNGASSSIPVLYVPGLEIWLGPDSRLDAAARAVTALDQSGRPYGVVSNGGSITIGGIGGTATDGTTKTTAAQIVIVAGAVLDASGSSAEIDPAAGTGSASAGLGDGLDSGIRLVASNGGSIALSSYDGIFVAGMLRAASGGAGASGGSLSLLLETPVYDGFSPADNLRQAREIIVSATAPSILPAGLQAGDATPDDLFAHAYLGADQVDRGGFDALTLSVRGVIAFDGNVTLRTGQSITLVNAILGDVTGSGRVTLVAPYVHLSGLTTLSLLAGDYASLVTQSWAPPDLASSAVFKVSADLIDLQNDLRFGTDASITLSDGSARAVDIAGFGDIDLASSGDLRFLGAEGSASNKTTLITNSNVTLQAAQLYPVTGATATVVAGYDFQKAAETTPPNPLSVTGVLEILRSTSTIPAAPLSVGGSLTLAAGTVIQDGIVRAPLGTISLGVVGSASTIVGFGKATDVTTERTELLPGSITSVSADGETIPYGGTSDTVSYTYNGAGVGSFTPTITLAAQSILAEADATLDLRGGGTLTGGSGELLSTNANGVTTLISQGFISGRGGSADVLVTPLLQFNAASLTPPAATLQSDPVYAVIAGNPYTYAPVTALDSNANYYGSLPGVGQQITIGAGVPGLAAGTYTLLPSYYALLPGGFRVELASTGGHAAPQTAAAIGNGSYEVAGRTGIANTSVQAALTIPVYVTSGAAVRQYSEYEEEGYGTYETTEAATFDRVRPLLPSDAGTLTLSYPEREGRLPSLTFDATALFAPADGGYGGTLAVEGTLFTNFDIIGPGTGTSDAAAAHAAPVVQIAATSLDQIDAPRMIIGGTASYNAAQSADDPGGLLDGSAASVTVESGAVLAAPEVILLAAALVRKGSITVDDGARIDTVGTGAAPFASTGLPFTYDAQRYTTLVVSNGLVEQAPVNLSDHASSGPLTIADGAQLYAGGTILASTESIVSIGAGADFGAASLIIAVPTVNIGAPADPSTPMLPGLTLQSNQLADLLRGDAAAGTPALQSLEITASASVNFFGTVNFSTIDPATGKSSLQELVLNTPAIYGQGTAGDTATLITNTLVWNGVSETTGSTVSSATPSGVIAGGAGSGLGSLTLQAQTIVLGFPDGVSPTQDITLDRTILGFATVNLVAEQAIVFNNKGTLSVYEQPGSGGQLNLMTPLITGASGAQATITAGGTLALLTPAGLAPTQAAQPGQGATLSLSAPAITDATTIALASGALSMTATAGDLTLAAGARLDLRGPTDRLLEQTRYSPGGTVQLESSTGNVSENAGAVIDVSSSGAAGGSISVTAPAGSVTLNGTLNGGGGDGGSFSLRAGSLPDFDALNSALDSGGFFESRSFDVATGDLEVDHTVQAHAVSITASGGNLTVSGTIDASGSTPGSIQLAAAGNLTLAASALLDAHATQPQLDSNGDVIDASNRADVSLTARAGTLTLASGAIIDVSNATASTLGTVELYAPRVGGNNIAIAASGTQVIRGAESIALYGMQSYVPADGMVTQSYLDGIDTDSTAFINGALANGALLQNVAGLGAYRSAFHLRPGVEIDSTSSDGNLTVSGDIDLAGYRYASLNPDSQLTAGVVGSGEPGLLVLRAGGDLSVFGSITDGFGTPVDGAKKSNPDDNGWVLYKGTQPLGQDVVVPISVTLATGTYYPTDSNVALNYPITIAATVIKPNVVIPMSVTLTGQYTIPAGGMVARANVYDDSGDLLYTSGQIIPAGTPLYSGYVLAAGSVMPFAVHIAPDAVVPAGTNLSIFQHDVVRLDTATVVPAGGLLPAGTSVQLQSGSQLALRSTTNGVQGSILATAPLLGAGTLSWSLRLVSGANLGSADSRAVQASSVLANAANGGNLVLSDPHYVEPGARSTAEPGLSVIRTGTGDLDLIAGGNLTEASLYGIYTAGAQSADVDAADELPRGTGSNGKVLASTGKHGYDYNALLTGYSAWYPTGGGDVLVSAQGDLTGDVVSLKQNGGSVYQSDAVGNWLWRQGGSTGQATAWWINFGSYVDVGSDNTLVLAGFTGIGALGGGNVTVLAGGDAGNLTFNGSSTDHSLALDVVVASTGRVTSVSSTDGIVTGGTEILTGGGNVEVRIAGALNPANTGNSNNGLDNSLFGVIGDLRGNVAVSAGAIGYVAPSSATLSTGPLQIEVSDAAGGPLLVLGDAQASLTSRGDLVLGGVIDPTRVATANTTAFTTTLDDGTVITESGGGRVAFSLWNATTSIDLFSAGGTVVPTLDISDAMVAADMQDLYPPILRVVAATGDIVYAGAYAAAGEQGASLELAPSPVGQLELLAGGSIDAAGLSSLKSLGIDISGAADDVNDLPNPYRPAWQGSYPGVGGSTNTTSNVTDGFDGAGYTSLFAFEADTATGDLHANDTTPALIEAASGDIIDLRFGETWRFFSGNDTLATWYIAAKPARIEAGLDIVAAGSPNLRPALSAIEPSGLSTTQNLILNTAAGDVSVVSAQRDIFYANFDIAGPGTLEVSAGRNLYQADQGSLYSVGGIASGSGGTPNGGAGIIALAGMAGNTPDWSAFANLYLNPANLADPTQPLGTAANAGKVAATYQTQLLAWLQQTVGYTGTADAALATFDTLPSELQSVFLLTVYFDELNASGLEYTNADSPRYKSYVRGRDAIAALFPHTEAGSGDITLYGGSGIATAFGGDIVALAPGGQVVLGLANVPPPTPATGQPAAGLITFGSGSVDIFAEDSVLLGQSRIFTTYGGDIMIWSVAGDISAGLGSKTTQVYQPARIDYDNYGDITLSPTAPTNGAGIATLAPIPGIPPGDVNLVAPLGTIDAGEAGIRASGNVNLAAAVIANAANVTAGGSKTGLPTVAAPNVGALASNAAAAAAGETANAPQTGGRQQQNQDVPALITVEVISFGGGGGEAPDTSCHDPKGCAPSTGL
jgi:filamentous hemagglutinin family protein